MNPEHLFPRRRFLLPCLALLVLASPATRAASVPPGAIATAATPAAKARFEAPTPVGQVSVPGEVEELVPGGAVDWSGMTVRARGAGVLDPGNPDRNQAWQTAEQAAVTVAQRNLLEIVKGLRVDSDNRLQDLMAEHDTVSWLVGAIVKGARPGGPATYDSTGGTVEVELECDLYGAVGIENALTSLPAADTPAGAADTGEVSDSSQDFLRRYSGLVLDGANTALKPSLSPKIYDESGNLLLDLRDCLTNPDVSGNYVVQYVAKLEQVLSRPDFARPPLVLKVKGVRGKLGTDIVLGKTDADKVMSFKNAIQFLVGTGRVLVRLAM
ncbi:MAG TPA: hypothetical protein VMH22_14235 [bacterium]|nr:hypothetical protein [bacterium]